MIINQSGPLLNLTFVNPFYLSAKPPTLLDNCQERVGLTIFPEIDQPWKTTLPCQKKDSKVQIPTTFCAIRNDKSITAL